MLRLVPGSVGALGANGSAFPEATRVDLPLGKVTQVTLNPFVTGPLAGATEELAGARVLTACSGVWRQPDEQGLSVRAWQCVDLTMKLHHASAHLAWAVTVLGAPGAGLAGTRPPSMTDAVRMRRG